jgi:hypothetical protein
MELIVGGVEAVHPRLGREWRIGDDEVEGLELSGDTASFPGRLPHRYRNAGEVDAILIGARARYG